MSVIRERNWTTKKGLKRAYVVDYVDQNKVRHMRQFKTKKEAEAFRDKTGVEVRENAHVPDSLTISVAQAGDEWLKACRNDLEPTTMLQYEQHLRLHIKPFIGNMKVSKITVREVRDFMDKLAEAGRSQAMVKSIRTSLSGILAEAVERGHTNRNAVQQLSKRKRREAKQVARKKKKLTPGEDIPTLDEIRLILANLTEYRAVITTAIFTGMRASELRGLRWADVDFEKRNINITQRADAMRVLGEPKSDAGKRKVPLFPNVANTLKDWKSRCPTSKLDLVFPDPEGNVINIEHIVRKGLWPAEVAAGLTKPKLVRNSARQPLLDEQGNEQFVMAPKYPGLHALRHFFVSWCINPKSRGGRGMEIKEVSTIVGHATVALTYDTYGHLFEHKTDEAAMAEDEAALLNPLVVSNR